MIHRRSDDTTRAIGEIAELALSCDDQAAFRDRLLDRLDQLIGFDLASLHSARDPRQVSMRLRGYDADLVAERLLGYMMEFEPGELAAADSGRPLVDTEVLPLRRRERLSLYREQLRPHGVSVMMTAMWRGHNAGFGFHLARCGRGHKFHRREIETLEQLLPAIKLAESYVAVRAIAADHPATRSFDAWADQVGLTRAERRVAELVVRGLQNREIATILGVSSLTVRNQLGAVFRKADVTNRSELAFVCASSHGDRRSVDELPAWSDFFRSPSHAR